MAGSVAGRLPVRPRLSHAASRRRLVPPSAPGPLRLPLGGLAVSAIVHALIVVALSVTLVWTTQDATQKLYVVNLIPAVAAVGVPTASSTASIPTRAVAPAPAARVPAPEPVAPEPLPPRRPARLPEPSLSSPQLPAPSRPALPKAGEKELPSLASPRLATTAPTTRPDKTDKAAETRPAPSATLGLPTGSAAGMGAQSMDASDFPYAWYLRQVLQKVQGQWQRQNRANEPDQKPLVLVEIQRDGSIRAPRIEQSSGNMAYDQAALRAVMDASPFPPLPQDWSKPSLRVMFRFDLIPARG